HVGLAAATPAGPAGAVTVGHHAHLEQALADGSASWADLLPDTAGWAMVAAHTVAALALLLAVTAAESVITGLGTILRRGLDAALAVLAAAGAHRPLPRPVASLTPDRWLPAAPVGAVVARRPLRRGPPRPLGA
ncbi:MAG: hypothetical protein LCH60_15415, partial [Actinobacteria bacterium]|nr:hypothetical protein [Actinomycetota bacterium]